MKKAAERQRPEWEKNVMQFSWYLFEYGVFYSQTTTIV